MENSLFSGVLKFRQCPASLQCAGILEHLKSITFPFETNGKLMILGVPILKHFRVFKIIFLINPRISLEICSTQFPLAGYRFGF